MTTGLSRWTTTVFGALALAFVGPSATQARETTKTPNGAAAGRAVLDVVRNPSVGRCLDSAHSVVTGWNLPGSVRRGHPTVVTPYDAHPSIGWSFLGKELLEHENELAYSPRPRPVGVELTFRFGHRRAARPTPTSRRPVGRYTHRVRSTVRAATAPPEATDIALAEAVARPPSHPFTLAGLCREGDGRPEDPAATRSLTVPVESPDVAEGASSADS